MRRGAHGRLQDDVDVAADVGLVRGGDRRGAQVEVRVEAVEDVVHAVGRDAEDVLDDLVCVAAALLEADWCGCVSVCIRGWWVRGCGGLPR